MFVREKRIGRYRYIYLVESVREDGKIKQRILKNLGRKAVVEARGARWSCRWARAARRRRFAVGGSDRRYCSSDCEPRPAAGR